MSDQTRAVPHPALEAQAETLRDGFRKLDRRQWWLWSTTVLVLVLLTIAVASFAFPPLLSVWDPAHSGDLSLSVQALVGIVLVFAVYAVYQQHQIIRMRCQIADQIDALSKVETLTSEVYKLAALDQLTGLYNRRSGEQRLAEEMSRAVRHHRPLTLLLIDVDNLKYINDRWGHAAGDQLLKKFADRLQRAIRGSDLAVRLGGDEFMVLLPECRIEEVKHVLGRVEGLHIDYDNQKLECAFSRGWADFHVGETAQELLNRADAALYEHKRSRKRDANSSHSAPVPQSVV